MFRILGQLMQPYRIRPQETIHTSQTDSPSTSEESTPDKIQNAHDLRALMLAAINIVNEDQWPDTPEKLIALSDEELAQLQGVQHNKNIQLIELFKQCIASHCTDQQVFLTNSGTNQLKSASPADLTQDQIKSLDDLSKNTDLARIILLVDDSLLNLKLLFTKVSLTIEPLIRQIKSEALSKLKPDRWQDQGFVIERLGNLDIICAANGLIAGKMVERTAIKATITDQEMPGMLGTDLIKFIRNLELEGSRTRMQIALHTALKLTGGESDQDIDLYLQKGELQDTALRVFFDAAELFSDINPPQQSLRPPQNIN